MIMSQKTFRRPVLYRFFVASAACAVFMLSTALAGPLAGGFDSYATRPSDFGYFNFTPIPANFFDSGSDSGSDSGPGSGSDSGPTRAGAPCRRLTKCLGVS